MFAAGQIGAESLDPYASLRCPVGQQVAQLYGNVQGAAATAQLGPPGPGLDPSLGQGQAPVGDLGAPTRMEAVEAGTMRQQQQHLVPTAAQHLEAMLPWNRTRYLRVGCERGFRATCFKQT